MSEDQDQTADRSEQETGRLAKNKSAYEKRVQELLEERKQREAERKKLYERIEREQYTKKMEAQMRVQREKHKRELEEARAKLKKPTK